MSDDVLVQGVLAVIKADNAADLCEFIEKKGVSKDIQFPPELDSEPEFLRNGAPLVCVAAYFGATRCLQYLVSIGADKDNADDDGMTASFYAAAGGKPGVIELLSEMGFDVKGCGQAAIRFGQFDLFRSLLEKSIVKVDDTDFNDSTFLHIAAFHGDADIVGFLASSRQIPVNAADREGRTALHLAAGNGFFEVCDLLVRNGGDPTMADKFGKSPMHYAAVQENYKIVELFLGGNLNSIHSDGMSPLMKAAVEGRAALCQLLLEISEVDPNLRNTDGMTALHLAIRHKQGQTTQLLLNCQRVDANAQDGAGMTPLHWAARKKQMDTVALLLKKGVDIHVKNNDGLTALEDLNERIERPPKPPGD